MRMTLLWCTGLAALTIVCGQGNSVAAPDADKLLGSSFEAKIHPWLKTRLASGEMARMLVHLEEIPLRDSDLPALRPERTRAVYDLLRRHARESQASLVGWLSSRGVRARSFFVVNALALEGDISLARQIAMRPEVVEVAGNPLVRGLDDLQECEGALMTLAPAAIDSGPEWGVTAINADDVWTTYGKHGEGIVIMSADTGVQWDHPALKSKYRGWDGVSASHDYNWHDAIDDLSAPTDDNDHGTHTTGTMVGDDGAGNQIGVAPGARWIACRNMDHGDGMPSTYIDCMQWAMAPYPIGGDPFLDGQPSLAPDLINNSWGCPASEGCSANTLKSAFENLRSAGILPVVSNGNSGPGCATTLSPPALYEASFSVGATDSSNTIASFSSRGPVTADGSNRRKPDVSAPGVSVRSSVRNSAYSVFSGTSMAGPHVSGAAALIWSVTPSLRPALRITQCLLERSAHPVGNSFVQSCGGDNPGDRPNNVWGWGLIDVLAAIQYGPDGDSDGVADRCDCAKMDAGAFDLPSEITGVRYAADRTTLLWDSQSALAGAGTTYDVARGLISELRSNGDYSQAICLRMSIAADQTTDGSLPPTGDVFYYLVRARNVCGIAGYGLDSSGGVRSITACP